MKRIIVGVITIVVAICAYAQKDVTQFLGIPVDGSKSAMVQKLKAKGFRANSYNKDVLEGEFNGVDVNVFIGTNSGKVCRVMICDANAIDERSIQIRFNNLCHQFLNKENYIPCSTDTCMFPEYEDIAIPQNEDIRYEVQVNNKRYEAAFYQLPAPKDSLIKDIEPLSFISLRHTDRAGNEIDVYPICKLSELYSKRSVWFMISERFGKYYITMFYDNEYNRANGEDL